MRTRVFACLAALVLAGCVAPDETAPAVPQDNLPSLAADQDKPLLALADHVLGNFFASDVGARPTTCIASNDGREDAALPQEDELALMTRYPALAPLARCALKDGTWQDADSGQPAMAFTVHSFTCADTDTCTGFAGYVAGEASSLSSRYTMAWDGTAWQFTRDDRLMGEQ